MSAPDPFLRKPSSDSSKPTKSGRRRGRRWLTAAIVVLVLGAVVAGTTQLSGLVGSDETSSVLTHTVERGDLVISVTEDGNLESARNRDIKCEVAGGSTILSIVEDGTRVKMGDTLVELESSGLQDQLSQQQIAVAKAQTTKIQADVDLEVAEISIREYLEGTVKKELQDIDAQITIAMENLRGAEDSLEYTTRMRRKGYATPLQLDAQKFAVKRAELELASARSARTVLEDFTMVKTVKGLEAQRDAAKERVRSEQAALQLEEAKLKRLTDALDKCVIKAPQDGMVIYANNRGRFGSSSQQIEEGTAVREQQTIIQLPDLSQMQVKVTVHESKVEKLRPGMRARIRIQDRELQGTIIRIASQPEPGGWMSANVKEYATYVKVDGEPEDLKPGMTAQVEILVAHLKDVLTVPVQAIVEQSGGKFYCWVQTPKGPERRPVVVGANSDKFIEVQDGVSVGEKVLLNPRAVVPEAREAIEVEEAVNVEKRFGSSTDSPPSSAGPVNEQQERPATGEEGRGGESGGRRGGGRSMNLMQYDQDGDGKVSLSEIPEGIGADQWFGRIDANGDGSIDSEEAAAIEQRRRGGGGARNLMQYDADGDGKVSRAEVPESMQSFFDRLDTNGDGFIDAAEIAAMRSRFQQGGDRGPGAAGAGGPSE